MSEEHPKEGFGADCKDELQERNLGICLSPTRCWAWMSQSVRRSQRRKCAFLNASRRAAWEEAGPVYLLTETTGSGSTSC